MPRCVGDGMSEEALPPGKHPRIRITVSGRVEAVRAVSPRLLFFTIVHTEQLQPHLPLSTPPLPPDGHRTECLAKVRDGYMNEQEIAMLRDELVCDAWISLLGFPEVEPASMQRDQANGRVMHAVQVTVLAGGGSVAGDEESPEHGSPRLLRIPSGLPPDSPTSEPISSRLAVGNAKRSSNQAWCSLEKRSPRRQYGPLRSFCATCDAYSCAEHLPRCSQLLRYLRWSKSGEEA